MYTVVDRSKPVHANSKKVCLNPLPQEDPFELAQSKPSFIEVITPTYTNTSTHAHAQILYICTVSVQYNTGPESNDAAYDHQSSKQSNYLSPKSNNIHGQCAKHSTCTLQSAKFTDNPILQIRQATEQYKAPRSKSKSDPTSASTKATTIQHTCTVRPTSLLKYLRYLVGYALFNDNIVSDGDTDKASKCITAIEQQTGDVGKHLV